MEFSMIDFGLLANNMEVLEISITGWVISLVTMAIAYVGTRLIWASPTPTVVNVEIGEDLSEDEPEIIACEAGEDLGYYIDSDSMVILAMEGPGELITDPDAADTGNYTDHCGYLCACGDCAEIL